MASGLGNLYGLRPRELGQNSPKLFDTTVSGFFGASGPTLKITVNLKFLDTTVSSFFGASGPALETTVSLKPLDTTVSRNIIWKPQTFILRKE